MAETLHALSDLAILQHENLLQDQRMVRNNAGGFSFILDDWERLNRFLILGSTAGTYYVDQQTLTMQNAEVVLRCLKHDGPRVVRETWAVNISNLAPKVDQQLFVMAVALKYGDAATKKEAAAAVPGMLRTGTHVLHFMAMLKGLGHWSSKTTRRVLATWFEIPDVDKLAYQVLKYQQRDGFHMRDLLRLAHPKPPTDAHAAVYRWILGKLQPQDKDALPGVLKAHTMLLAMQDSEVEKALFGIRAGLPREALPTDALTDIAVWTALLPHTPPHALLRNLGNLSAKGTLTNGGDATNLAVGKLCDHAALAKARVHPFAILLATLIYQQGHGFRGNLSWPVIPAIVAALENAYDQAFAQVTSTNKRILVAIDVSVSMSKTCMGTPIPAALAAAAMAITLARSEPNAMVVRFDTAVRDVMPVTRRTSISSLQRVDGGGTDLAAPLYWAMGEVPAERRMRWQMNAPRPQAALQPQTFDAIVILTDNETWAGKLNLSQLLERYRQTIAPGVKLVVCAMAASHASVVDPDDPLSLGCAGLDANLPTLINAFI